MNAEFNWWLLIVGIVAGAGLAWLVLAEMARRERDVSDAELPAEAAWIERTLADQGVRVSAVEAEAVLQAHRTYLGYPPPDALVDPDELRPIEAAGPPEALTGGAGPGTVPDAAAATGRATEGTAVPDEHEERASV